MKKDPGNERVSALGRIFAGEKLASICALLGRSRSWLYKWLRRYSPADATWCQSQSRRPHASPRRIHADVEEAVRIVRLSLYNQGLFCGDQAIRWELDDLGVKPLPSIRTISRILDRHGLTHRRTGRYEPKGKCYPALPALFPNQTQQADMVGPCYLKGPIRFYSMNAIDVAINRCGIQPVKFRSAQNILDAVWAIWKRLGIPDNLQTDNEMSFYGSPRHPRGMGPLIRLCLLCGVDLWFIPVGEPWRNGGVEKFNDHYRQKFLSKVVMMSDEELTEESLVYEHKHNSTYRYSKINGQTPLIALARHGRKLVFPEQEQAPRHPLEKPESGCYHLVRFIRSDLRLNIFGELFIAPPETQYEYVVATIDVKEQKMKLFLAQKQVEEYKYQLRATGH
jgi:transposase InsO family protein